MFPFTDAPSSIIRVPPMTLIFPFSVASFVIVRESPGPIF